MKEDVNETSCPGVSALPSLNTVRCLWSHAANHGSCQKIILNATQDLEVRGQRQVASPQIAQVLWCLALSLSGRQWGAVCSLALQPAQEQEHF